MTASLQDISRPAARNTAPSSVPNAELQIYAEEAQNFIDTDKDTQEYLKQRGHIYGTDNNGYLLDSQGRSTFDHISTMTGNTPGAMEADRRARGRITLLRAQQQTPSSDSGQSADSAFPSPAAEASGWETPQQSGATPEQQQSVDSIQRRKAGLNEYGEPAARGKYSSSPQPDTVRDVRQPRNSRNSVTPINPQAKKSAPSAIRAGVMATIDYGTWSGIVAAYRQRRQNYKTMKRRERMEAKAAAGTLRPPSKLLFFPLIGLAIIADGLGILAQLVNLTGIGAFAVSFFSFCLGVFFFIVGIFLSRRIKATRQAGNEMKEKISILERRIILLQQQTARLNSFVRRNALKRSSLRTTWKRKLFVRVSRKLSSVTRKITTWSRWIGRRLRYVIWVIESIPFINLLPWFTINMVLLYRERRQEYDAAMETVSQYVPVDAEEDAAFTDLESVDAERIKASVGFTA